MVQRSKRCSSSNAETLAMFPIELGGSLVVSWAETQVVNPTLEMLARIQTAKGWSWFLGSSKAPKRGLEQGSISSARTTPRRARLIEDHWVFACINLSGYSKTSTTFHNSVFLSKLRCVASQQSCVLAFSCQRFLKLRTKRGAKRGPSKLVVMASC